MKFNLKPQLRYDNLECANPVKKGMSTQPTGRQVRYHLKILK